MPNPISFSQMELPSVSPRLLWSFLLHAMLFWCLIVPSRCATVSSNETDRLALLAFKDRITGDPLHAMSSWNDSLHFCKWRGITCSLRDQRVTVLNLTSLDLVGSIPPQLGNLTFLNVINLGDNSFLGEIPQEIGLLFRLQLLNLSYNSLVGKIPSNLTYCSDLQIINLAFNQLVDEIPVQLSSLSKLRQLSLYHNHLIGRIPPSLGNLSSLTRLSLARNNLEGIIPSDIGRIPNLQFLQISQNSLSGTIPSAIYNLSSLFLLSVTLNRLHGTLPPDLGIRLPNLQLFYVSANRFTGQIPVSLANASLLQELYFTNNDFTGGVPMDIGTLQYLRIFSIGGNRLGTGEEDELKFIDSLPNCSYLEKFGFHNNSFQGLLPISIANLSTRLDWLAIGFNHLYGSIPPGIGNLISLAQLNLDHNNFTGTIPISIGKLNKLQFLDLSGNRFSGQIPSSFGNFTELIELYLQENSLTGNIPSSLGNCQKLLVLNLSQNNLNGTIPKQLFSLSSLSISLNLARNSLIGSLPSEVGSLKNLQELDVSENKLSGEIPVSLSSCQSLERLYMEGNAFQGTIPQSLSTLRGLGELDFSRNSLSGQIPKYLESFTSLQKVNLSFNDFEGEVPIHGVFENASAISVIGNNQLCGGIPKLGLPKCLVPRSKRQRSLNFKVIIPVIVVGVCLILCSFCFATLCWRRKSRKKHLHTPSLEDRYTNISYAELLKATDGFSSHNLIGVGSYGSVYKGYFAWDGLTVAVKVLNLHQQGASRSFLAECDALKNVRHRNLIKILASCSSIDFKGNDFKALVFEYMPNGSLEEWLHHKADKESQPRSLNLIQRLNIAIDVAFALEYLHHHCQIPISHCDLKPSNILLDDDMVAHVSDFGIARFLSQAVDDHFRNNTNSIAIKGTIGYVPPEYGMGGNVSTSGDMYSYGILLLEMFTGKRPTENMFKEGLSLREFVNMALPNRVVEIVDLQLLNEQKEEQKLEQGIEDVIAFNHINTQEDERASLLGCLVSVLGIGIACSVESPRERMQMKDVVNKMHVIRDTFLGVGIHRKGSYKILS